MPLSTNARLGPYEIRSTLGAGGMGEVYQAFDTRLNRNVAIKVLRADRAITPELRARFEREARAIAALNHPNIVSVYDFIVDADRQYIVSELVEGSSLRSLLAGKPVPLRKLLDVATQVADGLAAAHAADFVHRDLKPENIMLTKEGRVKILDFGLARQDTQSVSDSGSTLTYVPDGAESASDTKSGVVLGTPRYMSPEQALGRQADYRSDQFSFGLILYELASGKQAFAKDSSLETMAAIVREEPPPLEEKLPAPLRWIIDRCLQKEPEQRYESTRDLYQELRNLRDHLSEAHSASGAALTPVAAAKKRRAWVIPAVIAAAGVVLGAVLAWILMPTGQDIGHYRYTPFASDAQNPVWSPDGKSVAYSGQAGNTQQVFIRYLNLPAPVQITHEPHDVTVLGWSADRNHLVVVEREASMPDKLATVPVLGGDLDFLMDVDLSDCSSLSPDGGSFAVLMRLPTSAAQTYQIGISHPLGAPLRPYQPAPFASRESYNRPVLRFSPDGKKLIFLRTGEKSSDETWLLPYPAGSGTPRRILTKLPSFTVTPRVSWLPDNRHIIVSLKIDQDAPSNLWVADTESDDLEALTAGNQNETDPVASPDGRSLLYQEFISNYDVVSVPLADGSVKPLISTGREESMAAWAADSDVLAWVTDRNGPHEIWVRSAAGSERPAVTAAQFPDGRNRWFMNPSPSPDGQKLIFNRIERDGTSRLWILSLAGGSPVRLTNVEPSSEMGGSWSPDGSRFAYVQVATGKISLMVVRTSGDAAPLTLRDHIYSSLPVWSPDGNWIAFQDDKGWNLISPAGKNSKLLGDWPTQSVVFSRDGRLIYGIMAGEHYEDLSAFTGDRAILFSVDLTTLRQKVIKDLGPDFIAKTPIGPGIRFTLTPDGKSLTYVTGKSRYDLWMLQGFRQPGWRARISDALGLK